MGVVFKRIGGLAQNHLYALDLRARAKFKDIDPVVGAHVEFAFSVDVLAGSPNLVALYIDQNCRDHSLGLYSDFRTLSFDQSHGVQV